ncbi:MAG: YheU family protein [Bdellovibrionales bacterium]|nr:YheU family protein [Bdellovibrionales bacterium]
MEPTNLKKDEIPPIEVPPSALSEEALHGIISNFILREGTDYGSVEVSLETKIKQVERQIQKGEIIIAFDPNTETVTLLTQQQWKKNPQS